LKAVKKIPLKRKIDPIGVTGIWTAMDRYEPLRTKLRPRLRLPRFSKSHHFLVASVHPPLLLEQPYLL